MKSRSVILMLTLGLSGCATLDRENCLSADWQLIGFNDAVAGREARRLEQHRDACKEYGVVPQIDQYLLGYDRGIPRYCTAINGYTAARDGKTLNPVCNGGPGPVFMRGFELGSVAYKQVVLLSDAERRLSALRTDQRADVRDLNDKRQLLVADGVASATRSFLLHELEELQHNIRLRTHQITQQQQTVQIERRYLMDLEADLRRQL